MSLRLSDSACIVSPRAVWLPRALLLRCCGVAHCSSSGLDSRLLCLGAQQNVKLVSSKAQQPCSIAYTRTSHCGKLHGQGLLKPMEVDRRSNLGKDQVRSDLLTLSRDVLSVLTAGIPSQKMHKKVYLGESWTGVYGASGNVTRLTDVECGGSPCAFCAPACPTIALTPSHSGVRRLHKAPLKVLDVWHTNDPCWAIDRNSIMPR